MGACDIDFDCQMIAWFEKYLSLNKVDDEMKMGIFHFIAEMLEVKQSAAVAALRKRLHSSKR